MPKKQTQKQMMEEWKKNVQKANEYGLNLTKYRKMRNAGTLPKLNDK